MFLLKYMAVLTRKIGLGCIQWRWKEFGEHGRKRGGNEEKKNKGEGRRGRETEGGSRGKEGRGEGRQKVGRQ